MRRRRGALAMNHYASGTIIAHNTAFTLGDIKAIGFGSETEKERPSYMGD